MRPAQAACDRLGSTSTMINAIQVKRIPRTAQTAGLYPFFAASHAVSTAKAAQITMMISSSGSPMFMKSPPSKSAERRRSAYTSLP